MSLAAMVLADRNEWLVRAYDRWIGLITFGAADRVREAVERTVQPGERLLDVGCGTGTLGVAAARLGAHVVAVDRSAAMLGVAREKARRAGVTVDWRQGDVAYPPVGPDYGDQPFDVATATFVLSEQSAELAELAIRRMAQAVRPGGRVIIADEVPPHGTLARLIDGLPRGLLTVLSFAALQELAPTRRHAWHRLLTQAGLTDVREQPDRAGNLTVFEATRPESLPSAAFTPTPLDDVLPRGIRAAALSAAAWLDLPIAVPAGVYTVGEPDHGSPVLLTGNFLASVEAVRAALQDRDAYLVVEDTSGWNVWCAGDAGLFNAEKAAALLELYPLERDADARRIIVPRLGGRVHERLAQLSHWEPIVGPIEARDLPAFLAGGMNPEMRSLDRLYRFRERARVAVLTLVQLPLFLLPLRLFSRTARHPAWRFGLLLSALLPAAHYRLPGATGMAKASIVGAAAAAGGVASRRLRVRQALILLATSALVGWVYQSSTPVIHWKRVWR